ncbi:MAG: 4Fe-4S dicluster domain-containing protein [Deltaproteobacteria bacterium]|nr:4Fe-4S dicluster domain-containing protein [Deltaproteobacteria bacterium]
MGHLGHLKEQYRDLVQRLSAGQVSLPEPEDERAREGFREILEIMYTPEEAAIAARLPITPATLPEIVKRVGMSAEELAPKLEAMCEKGVVVDLVSKRTGETRYLLSPPVVGFFEFSMMRVKDGIPKQRMAEALHAYTRGDPAFAREVFGGDTVIGRAMVHETAIGDTPDVLDWERATAVVSEATNHAVSNCYCRHEASHLGKACDAPQEICLSLNAGAEFVIRRGFGRAISKQEALDIMTSARKAGLVQIADNVLERPTYICNCCGCCCGQLQGINLWGLSAVNPSGFLAAADAQKCVGCSKCARACPIAAIHMEPSRHEAKRKNDIHSVVDDETCIGCGVCADVCGKDAMHMQRREQQPDVPRNSIERALRMALERGHLGDMLYYESAARGVGFLGEALRALLALEPAKRLMASEQVSSRFVRAALGRVKDPTK